MKYFISSQFPLQHLTLFIDRSFFIACTANLHFICLSVLDTKPQFQHHRRSKASLYLCTIWSRFPTRWFALLLMLTCCGLSQWWRAEHANKKIWCWNQFHKTHNKMETIDPIRSQHHMTFALAHQILVSGTTKTPSCFYKATQTLNWFLNNTQET